MKLKHFLLYAMGILIPTTVFSAEYYVVPGPNIKPETYSFLQAVPITMLPVPVPTPGVFTVVMFL